jgi:hypothetical protein
VSVALVRARDAEAIDPRINLVGEDKIWVVRTLEVLAMLPLALADGYAPAQMKIQASDPNECCGGNGDLMTPFFQVNDENGVGVVEGMIGGGSMGGSPEGGSRWYPGAPVLLDPGAYELEAWRATC